jgi:hypothetical protein
VTLTPTRIRFNLGSYYIHASPTLVAYERYVNATGAVLDKKTGFYRITPERFKELKSIFFVIGGSTYELTPNAQIWPRALNGLIDGKKDRIYLVMQGMPGYRMGFVIGRTFLEWFYSIYDTGNRRIGLATTQFTKAEIN